MPVTRLPLPATNSCTNAGITPSAVRPSELGSTGTSRQPRTSRPSSSAISSIRLRVLATCSASPGRKAVPTAYEPCGGSSKPASLVTSRRNASGTWIRMPAPSPELVSAPAAPRWSRLRRAVMRLAHDVVAGHTGQGRDERHAARVVLVARGRRGPGAAGRRADRSPSALPSLGWRPRGAWCRGRHWPARRSQAIKGPRSEAPLFQLTAPPAPRRLRAGPCRPRSRGRANVDRHRRTRPPRGGTARSRSTR